MIAKKIYKALLPFLFICFGGVLGYYFFFGYSWVDAVYMTVIAITTVGFGEVNPLNDWGKIFTVLLVLFSVVNYAFLLRVLSDAFAQNFFADMIKNKKKITKIQSFKGHTIICGYGKNGQETLKNLLPYHINCVVIDNQKAPLKNLEEIENIVTLLGDATDDSVLKQAGIERAKNFVVSFPSDADNLYTILSAKQMNTSLTIVSRATCESARKKMMTAGADNIILPDKLGGSYMALLLVSPHLVSFVNTISSRGDTATKLHEIPAKNFPISFFQRPLKSLDLRHKTGCNIIGFVTDSGEYIVNPSADILLTPLSNLIILGTKKQVESIATVYAS